MLKTGVKAFLYSFSVSLFAILAAHRAFLHDTSSHSEPLKITNKNIVLFLKKALPVKSPVKKIALSTLPEIYPTEQASASTGTSQEIILADNFDPNVFPLEIDSTPPSEPVLASSEIEPVSTADVLYSPDLSIPPVEISAEPIYQPDSSVHISPPKAKEVAIAATEPPLVPVQVENKRSSLNGQIGNPADLDHVALGETNLPIESMKKDEPSSSASSKKWVPLNDSPWVAAYSSAGAKNKLAAKNDAAPAFIPEKDFSGVQLADETAKNIIVPIPEKIMKNENLTPQLAYPRDSKDALKEKLIDAEIQVKEDEKQEEKETLLSKVDDEDVSLEAPKQVQEEKVTPPKKDDNILGKINSIFTSTTKKASQPEEDLKEKAIAKAQARRSLKKRLSQMKPVSILPTEIRLSFQPNRAEISGQTLRWVQAFASKAAESSDITLEIRIDGTTSPILQQRRLNLIHNILASKGVEYSKINTVFTSREPNSFILRTINSKQEDLGEKLKTNDRYTAPYIQW